MHLLNARTRIHKQNIDQHWQSPGHESKVWYMGERQAANPQLSMYPHSLIDHAALNAHPISEHDLFSDSAAVVRKQARAETAINDWTLETFLAIKLLPHQVFQSAEYLVDHEILYQVRVHRNL